MRAIGIFLLMTILQPLIAVCIADDDDCMDDTIYPGKFLCETIERYGIDSLISEKDFFVFYCDWGGAPWMIVTRDSTGYGFILPSRDHVTKRILSHPEYAFDTTYVTDHFTEIFNWILDSLDVYGNVYPRTVQEPFIDEPPYCGSYGFEVYRGDSLNTG